MSNRRKTRITGTLCLAVLSSLAFAIASGCSSSEAAPASGKDAPAKVEGASKFDKDQYLVELKSSGSCSAGKECKAEIILKAKGDFHINEKYPIKFKAADPAPDGVAYTKTTVKKEDGKISEKEGSLPVAFTLAKAGKAKISGTLSCSFCNDATCLMEKLDLELDVDAK